MCANHTLCEGKPPTKAMAMSWCFSVQRGVQMGWCMCAGMRESWASPCSFLAHCRMCPKHVEKERAKSLKIPPHSGAYRQANATTRFSERFLQGLQGCRAEGSQEGFLEGVLLTLAKVFREGAGSYKARVPFSGPLEGRYRGGPKPRNSLTWRERPLCLCPFACAPPTGCAAWGCSLPA